MMRWLGGLAARWQVWALAAALVVAATVWATVGPAVRTWWRGVPQVQEAGRAVRDELQALREERARLQGAVMELSRRIQALTRQADQHRARAEREAASRQRWEAEAARLRAHLAALERERRAVPAPGTIREAYDALRQLGY